MSSQLARPDGDDSSSVGDSTDNDAIQTEKRRVEALKPSAPKKRDYHIRIPSGFVVASTYFITYHLGVLYQCLFI